MTSTTVAGASSPLSTDVTGAPSPLSDKTKIRLLMRQKRRALSAEERRESSERVCAALLASPAIAAAIASHRPIAVYLATPDELDLSPFISAASRRGAFLVAPRWNGSSYSLSPLEGDGSAPVLGLHGIREPAAPSAAFLAAHPDFCREVAVWLVPGLAFSRDGVRLGYGGGWYDRMLASSSPDASILGIGFPFQLLDAIPCEPHDITVDTSYLRGQTPSPHK